MPRTARSLISNSAYHIVTRGNQRQKVFFENEDNERFIRTVMRYKKKFETKIYAYCLMPNHIHLLADPLEKMLLNKFMHGINMSYAKYFNHKYKKCGHLWQDRFKSFIVTKDSYILNCVNYIEYNPVRAKMVEKPEDYKWSSYRARVLGEPDLILDPIVL